MRVLLACSLGEIVGGVERSLLELLPLYKEQGCDMAVALPGPSDLSRAVSEMGIDWYDWQSPLLRRLRRMDRALVDLARLGKASLHMMRLLRKHQAKALYVHDTQAAMALWPLGLCCRVPLIWHAQAFVSNFGFEGRLMAASVRRIICNSEAMAKPFRENMPGQSKKLRVIFPPSYPKEARTDRHTMRERLGLKKDAFVVILAGRISPQKRQHIAIEAVALLRETLPIIRLLVIGAPLHGEAEGLARDKEYNEHLRQQVADCGLQDHVLFLGLRDDMADLLAAGDLSVCTAINDASPRVVVEAMAAGLPVVGVCSGGIPGQFEDSVEGKIIPPDQARALAEAISELAGNPQMRKLMSEAGRIRAKQYHPDHIAQQLAAVCKEVSAGVPA